MSRRMRSALASMARACSSKVSPAGVGATPCRRLLDRAAAHGLPVTLHRAIDTVRDPVTAADAAIALGVDRVLSSRGSPPAIERLETFQAMRARPVVAIALMAASGFDAGNVIRRPTGSGGGSPSLELSGGHA